MSRSLRSLSVLGCFFAIFVLFQGSIAKAQTFRGAILGTVTDSSGGDVAGATVTIKNVDTGLTRTVTTVEDGSYAARELPIGNYSITVDKEGFKEAIVTGVRVEVSGERRADFTLQPGRLTQKVEVLGEVLPMVESTSDTLGGIVESTVVTNLPVNGRDYQKLILLAPGAASGPDAITDSAGSYGTVSVNGARGRSNNYLLDGTDMNDGYRNDPAINEGGVFSTPATILTVEAIAEMRVASNFEAEYGRSAGSTIEIVTKSGSNGLHGGAFDFVRNTVLDARNFFNNSGPQGPFHLNQFGGDVGGPIRKDKTFFFIDYEGVRETGVESSPGCVPTQADFLANAPTTGDYSSINQVVQNLLALNPWPAAQNGADCLNPLAANYAATNVTIGTPFSNRVDNGIVKIDHNFNDKNILTGRYYIGDSSQLFPLALTGGGDLPNYNTFTPTRVQLISISYVSTFSPAMLNETRIGWNRFAEGFFAEDRTFNPMSIGLDTVGPYTPNNSNPYNFGMPVIDVTGLPQIGSDKADPRQRVDTNWHYIDNISWKVGKHDIKFGYEFRRTSVSQIFNRTFRGKLVFDSLADFLEGSPDPEFSTQGIGDTNRNTFENNHAGYVQDSYRMTRAFTLNLGLRYDYFGIVQEKHELFNNVDPTTGAVFNIGPNRLYQPDYKNWAPRVSLAWDVSGHQRTVVRAGYGIFYDAVSQDMFIGHLPFSSSFDPGVGYSGVANVGQILFGSTTGTIQFCNSSNTSLCQPVFGNYTPMGDAFGIDPHIRTPYLQNYNLNIQQQFTRKMVLQVGYVGSHGVKLWDFRDINQPSAAQIWAADCAGVTPLPAVGQPCPGGTINDGDVPRRLTNNLFYIYWQESAAKSDYNALQTSFRIDDWYGLTTSVNFTWSHSIDTASDGEDYVPNAAQPTDSTEPQLNRGNSNFDVRKRLTWNFIYQFPNRKGSLQRLTNGWGLNGILTVQDGMPFHMILEADDFDGSATYFSKPDIVGPIHYNYSDPTHFLDLTSFAVPCTYSGTDGMADSCEPGTRHFGNEGRNSLLGPPFRQLDFSLFKNTPITERLKLELRFEVYNLFNHPNFANPLWPNFLSDPTLVSTCGTTPGCANSIGSNGRLVGFLPITTTADVGPGYPFLGGGGPRNLQIAAKFTF